MTAADLAEFEEQVRERGYSMNEFFVRAKVNKSTWNRWRRKKHKPNTGTLEKLDKALAKLPVRK